MHLGGVGIAVVTVLFLVVLVAVGLPASPPRAPLRRRHQHPDDDLVEDTDEQDIAEDDAPSRSDD